MLSLVKPAAEMIPTLVSVSSEYARLLQLQGSLNNERIVLIEKLRELNRENEREHGTQKLSVAVAHNERAARVLGADMPTDLASAATRKREMDEIQNRIADIEAALPIVQDKVMNERRRASTLVIAEVEGHHRAMVEEILMLLGKLHRVNARYAAFADALNSDGVMWGGMRPMAPAFLDSPLDSYGAVARYFREAIDGGFAKPADLPSEFRR